MNYDTIVLGGGIMGSATAYYLAKSGERVLLLEQFEFGHNRGSSHGDSRIIRYSYNEPRYIELARDAYRLWGDVETESGEQLLIKTGGIDFGKSDETTLLETLNSVRLAGISHEWLSADEANRRFPQFQFDDDMAVLYQADSGMLKADVCVQTHLRLAGKYGATLIEKVPVTKIDIHPHSVTVYTPNMMYTAGRLVITAGAWAGRLLAETGVTVPLQPLRCQVAYFSPKDASLTQFDRSLMPVYIWHREHDINSAMYGLPSLNGSGVKAAFHTGQKVAHPDQINYMPDDAGVDAIRNTLRPHMPRLMDGDLLVTYICLYTMTPDEDFIVDTHPQYAHVAIGAGFSGHGFKFGTLIGKMLSDLVLHGSTPHDTSLFKIARFM
ncbi:MAG: N-methyl-L-tryptophan oxidase [Anaerolineae bacterium]|jgi:monomeric sarcosine oxidase|nr:N-methyl-L-tryptophan oxidase [Anaerolineae bacterium]